MSTSKSELVDYHLRLAALSVRDAAQRMTGDAEGTRLAEEARLSVERVRAHLASASEREVVR